MSFFSWFFFSKSCFYSTNSHQSCNILNKSAIWIAYQNSICLICAVSDVHISCTKIHTCKYILYDCTLPANSEWRVDPALACGTVFKIYVKPGFNTLLLSLEQGMSRYIASRDPEANCYSENRFVSHGTKLCVSGHRRISRQIYRL